MTIAPPCARYRPLMLMTLRAVAGVGALTATVAAGAASLQECAEIAASVDRLACYDALAGRTPVAAPPVAGNGVVPSSTLLAPKGAVPGVAAPESLMSRYWELDAADKRGIFNLIGYRTNYLLPVHLTSRINRSPSSPTQDTVNLPNYRHAEAKFQLSLRTKVLQDFGLPGADLWMGFTQIALWQVWNGEDSKPFRNSDYEPEMMYVVPTPASWRQLPFGWQWRHTQLGLAHQSNGQSDPLSRSWNRVYLAGGFERGDWSFTARIAHRLKEKLEDDNNPDLVSYRGRADFQLNWASGANAASLLYRTTLKNGYGAWHAEWSYPILRQHVNGVRWYVQAFSGYGEALTDYNFRQVSLGAGISFVQF